MAELASGAVSSLLGLIRNEALLLGRVQGDVQFIKEEMESINSFLGHLARTAPPGGEHNEQVRTWMKQVRDLAQACSSCIDKYLQRRNPVVYLARGGRLWRYVAWGPWFVQKMVAQHNAAIELRELKERARDVGQRRLRYGVEVPTTKAAAVGLSPSASGTPGVPFMSPSSQATAAAAAEDYDDNDDDHETAMAADSSDHRRRALEHRELKDYCAEKLANWLKTQEKTGSIPSISIVAPATEAKVIASDALAQASNNSEQKIWINLPEMQYSWDLPLLPTEILCHILLKCEPQNIGQQEKGDQNFRRQARRYRWKVTYEIYKMIYEIKVEDKIAEIKEKIENINRKKIKEIKSSDKLLDVLHQALLPTQDGAQTEDIITETAKKLKDHMEQVEPKPSICLDRTQYEDILRKVFPPSKLPPAQKATTAATATLGEDLIKEIIDNHRITLDIIRELLPKPSNDSVKPCQALEATTATTSGKDQVNEINNKIETGIIGDLLPKSQLPESNSVKERDTGIQGGRDQIANTSAIDAAIEETKKKMYRIKQEITEQLVIKGIVDKIKGYLENKKTMIILQDDGNYISGWEETINALRLLGCAAGSAVIVTTGNSHKAKEFCNPVQEPITYSRIALYQDIVLQLTASHHQVNNKDVNYPQIVHDILEKCEPHEFCMKIFMHALYANPNRSYEELSRLHGDLQASQKPLDTNAKKMFKFSYNDMPKEYKSCLLYLAIFPQSHEIRRSTIVGRWVTEGLITKEDWPSAVSKAERCFDVLIDRFFVEPCRKGATGKTKTCKVDDTVHGIITKIAKKQHIVETRLSHHLARHFSIFNDLRLRRSDDIKKFLKNLSQSPKWYLLKVLDLEGVKDQQVNDCLRDICSKIPRLKYLSLRGTDVTKLPNEINNLYELEVLDIRQTMLPDTETNKVLLLKLKRLLAGKIDLSPNTNTEFSSVRVPKKIEKMDNLEVLSNVNASWFGHELKDIRKLWQLRKLGVVIRDNENHFRQLFQVVGDLDECLQSLSITLTGTASRGTSSSKELPDYTRGLPKHLKSLSISGTTPRVQLLQLLAKGVDKLTKVNLHNTSLKQDDMKDLAKLPNLCCVRLRHNSYTDTKLTFKNDEFQNLKYLLCDGSNMTEISFEEKAAPKLEKIDLPCANSNGSPCANITGIYFKNEAAPKLQEISSSSNNIISITSEDRATPILKKIVSPCDVELELKGSRTASALRSLFSNSHQLAKVTLHHTSLKKADLQILAEHPSLHSLILLEKSCDESELSFNKDEFQKLRLLDVKCSTITKISFEEKAAPQLEKIDLSCAKIEAAPKLQEISSSSKNIISITSEDGATPILKKIVSPCDVELELKGSRTASVLRSLFSNSNQLAKVTLHHTSLKKADLQILAKQPNLHSLILLEKSCDESELSFNKDEFQKLRLLDVKCSAITKISFAQGAAPNLEQIAWSFTKMEYLSGIKNLPVLKELEVNGESIPDVVRKDIAEHPNHPVLKPDLPQNPGQGTGSSAAAATDSK